MNIKLRFVQLSLLAAAVLTTQKTQGQNQLLSTGNAGIGTTSPAFPLHVKTTNPNDWQVALENGAAQTYMNHNGNFGMYVNTGGTNSAARYAFHLRNSDQVHMHIQDDGLVGIGTQYPTANIHLQSGRAQQRIEATGDHATLILTSAGTSPGGVPSINLERGLGNAYGSFVVERGATGGNPPIFTGGLANDVVLGSTQDVPLKFGVNADIKMTLLSSGNVGIGITNPQQKLSVGGTIEATEILVQNVTNAPDFVFEEDYDLRSLKDTEAFIKENKHLPEVPSAAEMAQDGLELKKMNLLLLQKIEELTLHVIDLNERIVELEKAADNE